MSRIPSKIYILLFKQIVGFKIRYQFTTIYILKLARKRETEDPPILFWFFFSSFVGGGGGWQWALFFTLKIEKKLKCKLNVDTEHWHLSPSFLHALIVFLRSPVITGRPNLFSLHIYPPPPHTHILSSLFYLFVCAHSGEFIPSHKTCEFWKVSKLVKKLDRIKT
jgi:hypothetical protein